MIIETQLFCLKNINTNLENIFIIILQDKPQRQHPRPNDDIHHTHHPLF